MRLRTASMLALATAVSSTVVSSSVVGHAADAETAALPVSAPVDEVVVYSQQAKVFRRGRVTLQQGEAQLDLGLLPAAARGGSLQVECPTAEVRDVRVVRTRQRLSRQQAASALADRLEKVADELSAVDAERRLLVQEARLVDELQLAERLPPPPPGRRALLPELHVGAWRQILGWVEGRRGAIQRDLARLAEQRREVSQRLHRARVEARSFITEIEQIAAGQLVRRVRVRLRGDPGAHRLTMSYVVSGARWLPSYDLRYHPSRDIVEAAYYARVLQRSGEDWSGARLRFSTARPTALLAVPELPTWTVGRRRDFVPQPSERAEAAARAWQPPPLAAASAVDEVLVGRLRGLLGTAARAASAAAPVAGAGSPVSAISSAVSRIGSLVQRARRMRDVIQLQCLQSKLRPLQRLLRVVQGRGWSAARRQRVLAVVNRRVRSLQAQAEACVGSYAAKVGRTEVQKDVGVEEEAADEDAGEAPAAPPVEAERMGPAKPSADAAPPPPSAPRVLAQAARAVGGLFSSRPTPRETVPWNDVGYVPPQLHRDLPAAAAEGYRYTLYARGRHSVDGDGVERRIPVLRRSLKVRAVHRIAPGRSEAAYLVGQLDNNTGRPILRGHANLFAGEMFAGRSWINTALPGERLLLPLGVDDSVKVSRHLEQRTVRQGVVFKDDVTTYSVRIEIANHRRRAIEVEVEDQIPLESGDDVEIEGFDGRGWTKPDKQGRVRWRGRVGASSVKKLRFRFRIVRPKDWRLQQHGG